MKSFLPALCCSSFSSPGWSKNTNPEHGFVCRLWASVLLFFFLRALSPPCGSGQSQQEMLCDLPQPLGDVTSEVDVGCTRGSAWVLFDASPLCNTRKFVNVGFLIKAPHPVRTPPMTELVAVFVLFLAVFIS